MIKNHRSNWKKLKYQDQIIEEDEEFTDSDQETSTDESSNISKETDFYLMNIKSKKK